MLRRRLLQLSGLAFLGGLSHQAWSAIRPGVDYKNLREVQSITPHKKQVTEVFFYGCPHCYNLQESLYQWLRRKPNDVHFERLPAVLNNPSWVFMAKVYYAAEDLGIITKSNQAFFDALHRDKLPLNNLTAIARFHSQFGVTEQAFIDSFNSFKVDQSVRRSQRLTQAFGIEGVPSIVVNGQYLTSLSMSGGQTKLWQNVDQLLEL
jgi:thiol:disulfide interchange protein DsbA